MAEGGGAIDSTKPKRLEFSVRWVGFIAVLCEDIVKAFVSFNWKTDDKRFVPSSVEDWCLYGLGWRMDDLINVIGPLMLKSFHLAADPNDLTTEESLQLILHVLPRIPYRLKYIIQKLFRMKNVGYHDDFSLSVKSLDTLIEVTQSCVVEILRLQNDFFENVFENRLKNLNNELKTSKIKFKKAHQKSIKHKKVLEKTREELNRSKKAFNSVVKYEEFEINTTEFPPEKKSRSRMSTVSDLSEIVLNTLKEIQVKKDSGDTEILIEKDQGGEESPKRPVSYDLPKELRNELFEDTIDEEEFQIEEEFRKRADSNASAESLNLTLLRKVSKHDNKVSQLTHKSICVKTSSIEFFESVKQFEKSILSNFSPGMIHDVDFAKECFQRGEHICTHYDYSEISELCTKLRLKTLKFGDSKGVIDIKEWFSKKKVKVSPAVDVNLINLYVQDKRMGVNLDYIFDPRYDENVTLISGASGSGKSHLCNYILHQWRSFSATHPFLLQFDVVVGVTVKELRRYGSTVSFIEKNIFQGLSYENVESVFIEMQDVVSLFVIDTDCLTDDDFTLIEDCVAGMPFTKFIITSRPEFEAFLTLTLHTINKKIQKIQIQPFTLNTLSKEALNILAIKPSSIKALSDVVESPTLDPTLINPLYLSFIHFLLTTEESEVAISSTKSKLLAQLLAGCRKKIITDLSLLGRSTPPQTERKRGNEMEMKEMGKPKQSGLARHKIKTIADSILEELWETSWRLYFIEDISGKKDHLVEFRLAFDSDHDWLYPLALRSSGDKYVCFDSVCEALAGFHYAQYVFSDSLIKSILCWRTRNVLALSPRQQCFRKEVLIVSTGVLKLSRRFNKSLFVKLVSDFKISMTPEHNFFLWLRLIKESGFSNKVCRIVKRELKGCKTWTTCSGVGCSDGAVATLLRYEAFKPRLVIISEKCPSISYLVCGLALCPRVNVALRQMYQFCMWDNPNSSDELVESLQPTGNLIEFWGYLGPEGCNALRHMRRLRNAHVRITSLEALLNLSLSLNQIQNFDEFYLHFDLPKNTSVFSMPQLDFKWKLFNLSLREIKDSTYEWAKRVIAVLSSTYTNIYLEETKLCAENLQDIRKSGFCENVYVM